MSKGFIFKIVNNTGEEATLSASIGNADDWGDDTNRPDVNGAIGAFGNNHWHEELAQTSSTAPFTVNVAFSSGDTIQIDLDGWQARTEELRRKIRVRSSSAPKYAAFQYTGTPEPSLAQSNWLQMTLSSSLFRHILRSARRRGLIRALGGGSIEAQQRQVYGLLAEEFARRRVFFTSVTFA